MAPARAGDNSQDCRCLCPFDPPICFIIPKKHRDITVLFRYGADGGGRFAVQNKFGLRNTICIAPPTKRRLSRLGGRQFTGLSLSPPVRPPICFIIPKKHRDITVLFRYGADGGGRTHTMLPSRDFESRASASSTTSANYFLYFIINTLSLQVIFIIYRYFYKRYVLFFGFRLQYKVAIFYLRK